MIDLNRRKKLALHLRQLATGLISNDDFEERIMDDVTYGWLPEQFYRAKESKKDDEIIRPILEFSWCLYNDTYNHKLKGRHELTELQKKEIARFILFLHSEQEYEWNYVDMINPKIRFSFKESLKSILTFGKYYRDKKLSREQEFELMKKEGNFEYWPFKTKANYESQLEQKIFLAG